MIIGDICLYDEYVSMITKIKPDLHLGYSWRDFEPYTIVDFTLFTTLEIPPKYVWVVRQNSDLTEGRGVMVDVGVYETEEAAYEANKNIAGVMGHPPTLGGDIWKIKLGVYPLEQEKIFGYRQDWNGKFNQGWLDLRDKPNPEDPDWIEYERLRDKFGT
jgi:hypothetical protein